MFVHTEKPAKICIKAGRKAMQQHNFTLALEQKPFTGNAGCNSRCIFLFYIAFYAIRIKYNIF